MSDLPPDTDQLLATLAELLNTRMRLRDLRRDLVKRHSEAEACSTELDDLLRQFHQKLPSAKHDGLAD